MATRESAEHADQSANMREKDALHAKEGRVQQKESRLYVE